MNPAINNNISTRPTHSLRSGPANFGHSKAHCAQPQQLDHIADYVDQNNQDTVTTFITCQAPAVLVTPTVETTPDNIYALMAMIRQILTGSCEADLRFKLDLQSQLVTQKVTTLTQAVEQINSTKANLSARLDDLKNKTDQLDGAERALSDKNGQLAAAQNKLNDSKSQLEELANELRRNPDDVVTNEKYLAALNTFNADQQTLDQAKSAQADAVQNLEIAYNAASTAADAALIAQAAVVKATEDYVAIDRNGTVWALLINSNSPKSAMDVMVEIMAYLSEILNKNELSKLKSSNSLNLKLQDDRIKQCKELADKYTAAAQEAQANQAKAKRGNKIASWLVVGLSLLATPFCGPLAIAAAVAALTVAIGDEVMESKGEATWSEKIMVPMQFLIDNVAKGIVAVVGPILEHEAKRFGKDVDKDQLELASKIVASVMVTAVIAGASCGASKAAAGTQLAALANSTRFTINAAKYSPELLRTLFGVAHTVNGLVNQGFQAYMGVQVAHSLSAGKESEADMALVNAELSMLKAIIDRCVNQFCNADTSYELSKQVSDILTESNDSSCRIIRNIAA